MFQRRIPEWLRHAPAPSVRGFAVLAGGDATVRGILISVLPIVMYRTYEDAGLVSQVYFGIGLVSMIYSLLVPSITRIIPRRWMFTLGCLGYAASSLLAGFGSGHLVALALLGIMLSAVTVFICFNAYVLDYVASVELGRSETLRMFYSATAWCLGPAGGVLLLQWWRPAPFLIAVLAAFGLLVLFWWMRLGNGKLVVRARVPAPNPVAYLGRFFAQPRLIAGWLFAVIRSSGWWIYVVYLPVFAVEAGLGEDVGGFALSFSNGLLFLTPLMLRWVQKRSLRTAVRTGFLLSAAAFLAASLLSAWPWLTVGSLMAGTLFLVLLDICGGLPFLMAVKPSERTEMSAVYSSFRDVSGIVTPGVAWLVFLVAPVAGVFAAGAAGLAAAWLIAGRLHPRLGSRGSPSRPGRVSPAMAAAE